MESIIYQGGLALCHFKNERDVVILADQLFKKKQELRYERRLRKRKERSETWLFVCEGTKTEVKYIESLVNHANSLSNESPLKVVVHGTGINTVSLVKSVDEFYDYVDENRVKEKIPFAKTFVLFDKDSFGSSQFNSAIKIAQNKGYIPIWSNECFELWFILHFEYYTSNNGRQAYFDRLSELFGCEYEKADDIFKKIHSPKNLKNAMNFSEKLEEYHKKSLSPSQKVPCTQMYKVVEEINQKLRINLTDSK